MGFPRPGANQTVTCERRSDPGWDDSLQIVQYGRRCPKGVGCVAGGPG